MSTDATGDGVETRRLVIGLGFRTTAKQVLDDLGISWREERRWLSSTFAYTATVAQQEALDLQLAELARHMAYPDRGAQS